MRTNKKKDTPSKRGVFTLLLRNYIVFSLFLALIVTALLSWTIYRSFHTIIGTEVHEIEKNLTLLETGEYERFPAERLWGDQSRIAILDANGNTVYNQTDYAIDLTEEELSYLPLYEDADGVLVSEFEAADGTVNHEVRCLDEFGYDIGIYMLNEQYRLLYGSGNYIRHDLTERDYQLISQSYFDGFTVSRYPFKGRDGNSYLLLVFESEDYSFGTFRRVGHALLDGGIVFLLLYCTMILLFILWLKRKITRPLTIMCDSMNHYEIGAEIPTQYRGPREFQEIFHRFSLMANRLEESEVARKKLESDRQKILADIAHDLKTPISAISGYARALNDGIVPAEKQPTYLAAIDTRARELDHQINTFYEFSKIEHPDYHIVTEHTEMCIYFRNYVAEKYTELEMAKFVTQVEIPEEQVFCAVDVVQLKRVFENVVNNALKHNPAGTRMLFRLTHTAENVVLVIADDGIGIAPEVAKNIFDPFVVGEKSRHGSGSGLGLSIAKKIVSLHGGTIELKLGGDYKTAFEITLPLAE